MEFNKCNRCGCFFITSGNLCPNCISKDEADLSNLQNYMQNFNTPQSLHDVACNTGISIKNLNRHINNHPDIVKYFNIEK